MIKIPKQFKWSKGSRHSDGYVVVYMKTHPFADKNGRLYEHRLIMEKHLGRYLEPTEIIHHINKIRDDNKIENLKLFHNHSTHTTSESLERKKQGIKQGFQKGNIPPKHREGCPCPRCNFSYRSPGVFKKGHPPPPHKQKCKCFRCTKTSPNLRHKQRI